MIKIDGIPTKPNIIAPSWTNIIYNIGEKHKDSKTIGPIRLMLPGVSKNRVALLMYKKLLNKLATKGDIVGIQSILHLIISRVISLRVKKSIRSIHNIHRGLS